MEDLKRVQTQDERAQAMKRNEENTHSNTTAPQGESPPPQTGAGRQQAGMVSRRNLAAAGASASVMMSLFSRPVFGSSICSVSGLTSGNVSGHEHECSGQGCTPGYYKNNIDGWPPGYNPGTPVLKSSGKIDFYSAEGGTTFIGTFMFEPAIAGVEPFSSSPYPVTLWQVLNEHSAGNGQQDYGSLGTFHFHLVAALFNAEHAPTLYGATPDQVKALALAVNSGEGEYMGKTITRAEVAELFATLNERGDCFFNAHGEVEKGYTIVDGEVVAYCEAGYYYDRDKMMCVKEGSE
ncbi:hypothetical protein [Pseudomaricurvus sp. HS19]|uniref:hypothetical protein n=1 Tax=Pseudomaricurvus sp. HS19 TaxID=2692626 RepID=UPI00136DD538|nr:hypothetical protein [Pseudomaricurvus sp. HS19]MYM62016.1 hypothetical protein [Pseudomaricurvus sp. HS19]